LREEIANHGVDPAVRGRVTEERLRAMIEIWTQEKPEFHGEFVDFDPIYCWPKPVARPYPPPYPPLFLGGGPASFKRIARLDAGWIAISPAPRAIRRQLEELRAIAGHDVPVIVSHAGEQRADGIAGYADLGVQRVLLDLPTEPRDETLRRLDALQTEFARLA
jgi:alkanesulfonate monooxygenase SsuD/methylene tetrahydromethanopterin reductase-like flavin-dependent oxidoreductase (luciferase family)